MNIPKKINAVIKSDIVSYFKAHYNLEPSRGMDYLSAIIVKDFQTMITNKQYYGKSSLAKLLPLWFKTTNIGGELQKHSAYGFATFIDSNFYIISFDRRKKWHRILHYIIKKVI